MPPFMHPDPARTTGRELRYRLCVLLLEAGRPLKVADLLARLDASGWVFSQRASKVVSDALRCEVEHGRAVRVGRATYALGVVPRSTEWSIRRWIASKGCGRMSG